METGHAGLAVGAGGEVAALLAHAAVHARAVAVALARCGKENKRREEVQGGMLLIFPPPDSGLDRTV